MKRRKLFSYISLFLLTFCLFKINVNASSMKIWSNVSGNVTVGQKITISMQANGLAGKFNVSSSDTSVLSGGDNGFWLENDTATFEFKAESVGTATVTFVPSSKDSVSITEGSGGEFYDKKTITINVKNGSSNGNSSSGGTTSDKKTYSSDNNLASLSIEGFDINPVFNKNTTEYSLTVDQSVEKIKVNARANDNNAKVNGIGEINLSDGENIVEIKVIAENGNEKTYKIKVMVEDKNPIKVSIGNNEYTIMKKNKNILDKLENYEEGTIKINDQDVVSYTNPNNNLTLVILKDSKGNCAYYIYDNGNYTLYDENTFNSIKLLLLDIPKKMIPKGYIKAKFTYGDKKHTGYRFSPKSDYYLIYAMNLSNGEKGLYVYDKKIEVVSRYDNKMYDNNKKDDVKLYKEIIIAIIGIDVLIFIIATITSIIKSNKRKRRRVHI